MEFYFLRECCRTQAEQRNLKVEETSHHELMGLQERKAKAQQFRERTQALSSAVGVLEEAIDVSKSKVRHGLPA